MCWKPLSLLQLREGCPKLQTFKDHSCNSSIRGSFRVGLFGARVSKFDFNRRIGRGLCVAKSLVKTREGIPVNMRRRFLLWKEDIAMTL